MTNSTESPKGKFWTSTYLVHTALIMLVIGILYQCFRGVEQTIQTQDRYVELEGKVQKIKEIEIRYRNITRTAIQREVELTASQEVMTRLLVERDSLQTALNNQQKIKPKIYTRVIQEFKLPPVLIKYSDTSRYAMTDSLYQFLKDNPDGFVLVPKQFRKDTSLFSIQGQVHSRGVTIDSLSIPNEISLQIGYQKKHFLARSKPVITAVNSSPLIRSYLGQTLMLDPPKPKIHLGLQAGYGIQLNTFKPGPYLGVGLTYQPF